MYKLNETHDPALRSWVASANAADGDFPIQNLPLAIFRRRGSGETARGGVAIGDQVLDLAAAVRAGVFEGEALAAAQAACADNLNALMALSPRAWSALRLALSRALREGSATQHALERCLVTQADAEFELPARIGDYTDFYIGIHHATAVGKQFRPDNPLLPNYKWVPIGYHGRASSVVRQRHADPPPGGPDQGQRRPRPGLRPQPAHGLRAGTRAADRRCRQCDGRADRDGRRRDASVRRGAVQRLVGARHPALGIPAAGPVPVEELRQHAVAVGGDDGGAGAVSQRLRAPGRRPAAAALPGFAGQPRARRARHRSWRSGCKPRRCVRPGSRRCG
jgi:hypothetical protein